MSNVAETNTEGTGNKATTTITTKQKLPGIKDVLKNHNYRKLWIGQSIYDFGDNLTNLTLLILVNQLTGSAGAIATMLIVLAVPQITFGLLSGVFVDRWDRKRVMIVSDLLRGLFVLGFIFVGSKDTLPLLYGIAFVQAAIGTFFMPARSALMPGIVEPAMLLSANSLSQTSRIAFGLLGTGAAGIIVGLTGNYWVAFSLDALTFFVSVIMVSTVAAPARSQEETAAEGNVRVVFSQLQEGLALIFHTPTLSGTLVAMMMTMLGLGAVNVLAIPLIVNDLKVPVTWLGIVDFAQTGAMILSGSLVAIIATRLKPTSIISVALVIMGMSTIFMCFVGSIWHIFPILIAIGLALTPMQAAISTLMQSSAPNRLRGRISAALNTAISVASLVSMGLAGALGEVIGVRNVFVVSGLIVLAAALAATLMFRTHPRNTPASADAGVQTSLEKAVQ